MTELLHSMKTTTEKFRDATAAHIKDVWSKRKNPMFPNRPAKYPARVINFIHANIGGKRRLFRVQIQCLKSKHA